MSHQPLVDIADFDLPYEALLNTVWITNPANPLSHIRGYIGQGELIWLHPDHIGTGPIWQQARLVNQTLRYVQLHDFKEVVSL